MTLHDEQTAPAAAVATVVAPVPAAPDRLAPPSLLAGGEAREWLRAIDRAGHPLGDSGSWDPGLRSAVEICLSSRFPMLVWWGPDLRMVYNEAYRPMLGVKHPVAFGAPGREVWPEIWDVIGPMLTQVMGGAGATWVSDQLLVLDRSGVPEDCYFTYSFSPVTDASGRVGGVFCAVTETTERVVSERRLATLAEMAHLIRAEGREAVVATASAVLAGNPHDHPVALVVDGAPVGDGASPTAALEARLPHVPAGTRARLADHVRQVSLTGRPLRVEADAPATAMGVRGWHVLAVPEPGIPHTGHPAAVLVLGESARRPWDTSLEDYATLAAAHVAGALTVVGELTEVRAQRRALVELDEAKSQFLTNMSHELRTPLTLIAGPVQDALENETVPEQRARLELVDRSTRRLARMVDALLDFGRMEAGGLEPEPVLVDLTELTRGLAESFRPAIEREGLSFAHRCEELGAPAFVDRDMYERVVLNLLSNALKYTPAGSIELALVSGGDHVEVSVRDTGVGIPEEDLERAFARFERLPTWDGERSREGAGIGLAMVRQLTALMAGSVTVESTVGRGSTFTVRLPHRPGRSSGVGGSAPSVTPRRVDDFLREAGIWAGPQSLGPEPPRLEARRPGEPDGAARRRVLVAEDDPDLRRYLGNVLGGVYDLELVADGAAALAAARRDAPDLVLADVMMPGLDGHELVAAIRDDPALLGLPVVLLSARAGAAETSTGLEAGADDYLVKPFSVVELRARVASNLERADARLQDSAWRRALTDSLHDALVITDPRGTVLEVNERFTEMLGWEPGDGPFTPPYPWQPSDTVGGTSPADVVRLAAGPRAEPVEGDLVHRDGHRVRASARVSVVRGGRRRPDVILCTVRDESAEHEARQRRSASARLAAELGSAEELTDVLASAVAGFGDLFQGEATVRVHVGSRQHVFTAAGPMRATALEERVASALGEAEARAAGDGHAPGILLLAGGGAPQCMVWVDFSVPRRVGADEQITGDLLVEAFALACERVVAATSFAERERHLRLAIESHEEIGQAVGILVERHRWTPTMAFEGLKRASQDHNIKLRDIAARVIQSGADPREAGSDLAGRPRGRQPGA